MGRGKSSSLGLGRIVEVAKRHPFLFQLAICTTKTSACDLIIQTTVEGKRWSEIDWNRNMVFTAFGCVFLGGVQYWVYSIKFQQWFPHAATFAAASIRSKLKDRAGQRALLQQIAFDNVLFNPFVYLPVFYIFKASIQPVAGVAGVTEPGASDVAPHPSAVDVVKGGIAKWASCFWEDNKPMWMLCIPADVIVFGAPMWLRLPINHGVSFIWVCYLSFTRGDQPATAASEVAEVAAGADGVPSIHGTKHADAQDDR